MVPCSSSGEQAAAAPQCAAEERRQAEAESERSAAASAEATRAAERARGSHIPERDEQRLAEQTRVEECAARAAHLESEIVELQSAVAALSSRLDEVNAAARKDRSGVLARRAAGLQNSIDEHLGLLHRKQAELEEARREVRKSGGNDNVGGDWGGAATGALLKKLRMQLALGDECRRLETNLNFLDRSLERFGSPDDALDLSEAGATDCALYEDVYGLQQVIRHRVVRVQACA